MPTRERGSITLAHVYAIALSLVLFTVVANLVVHQYGHGVLRAVADEAVRAGARADPGRDAAVAACLRTGDRLRVGLLGAGLARASDLTCTTADGVVSATATATFPGWLAIVPDWDVEVTATAIREGVP